MIASRTVTKADLERAAKINDAIALEFDSGRDGAMTIGRHLGVDILGAALLGAEHARRRYPKPPSREDAIEGTTHAFTMGVVVGLRAVEVIGRE